ncbi:MAG: hypothetical protein COC12_13375, partial [Rhodobacteraceae bacterium]
MISASTIALYSNATVTENFTNSGTMVGDVELSGSVGGTFTNSGRIFGSIDMKQGADTFDGRGGWVEGDVKGGLGDDLLRGGSSRDKLNGGVGNDTLRGSPSDSITDFVIGEDRVDLSGLQPSLGYIGGGTFSGTAGEVQVTDQGTRSLIKVDVDGDSSWDMKIVVDGVTGLN